MFTEWRPVISKTILTKVKFTKLRPTHFIQYIFRNTAWNAEGESLCNLLNIAAANFEHETGSINVNKYIKLRPAKPQGETGSTQVYF